VAVIAGPSAALKRRPSISGDTKKPLGGFSMAKPLFLMAWAS
jgi:hypothetical protein